MAFDMRASLRRVALRNGEEFHAPLNRIADIAGFAPH
jgi:hypothetical protein